MDNNSVWKIAGGDPQILERCELKIQNIFSVIGWFVLVLSGICLISVFYASQMIFESYLLALPLSVFVTWVIINIYRLNLITLTKVLLPHRSSKVTTTSATILRIAFICLLAYIISRPIGELMFSKQIETVLTEHNREELNVLINSINTRYASEKSELVKELAKLNRNDGGVIPTPEVTAIRNFLNERLLENQTSYNASLIKVQTLYSSSNFFIKRQRILSNEFYGSYLISLLIIALFIIPIILKKRLEVTSSYYVRKSVIEREIILSNYKEFKSIYSQIMTKVTGGTIVFKENYLDAPFNTVKIPDRRKFQESGTLFDAL